ncbi:MAG: tRNA (adenosine(37)-N6)-threonylcarbamoyltransferase complex transferase subunit TsaD [Nitrospirales bacterium]|nr:tRNA (adenosine(37)-N6)-threonylcarbamoyltransferase complex transferase subunit TsaD [Nitrospirales bacterium]
MPSSALTLLGLETSCDETAAAVMRGEGVLLSSVLYSQHDVHRRYGGVVPELAARRHIETVEAVVAEAMAQAKIEWSDLHAVAVTSGPGLAGALLVGVSVGKALAYARGIPLIGVNHLEGHIASAWMECPDLPRPCMILVVSGGHTHLYLTRSVGAYQLIGHTLDDAAGEAFDKAAKMLGLDFPGGSALDRLAQSGNPAAISFPRPYLKNNNLDFSFSGIKTALLYYLRDLDRSGSPRPLADIAASYQEAIVEVLVEKAFAGVKRYKAHALAVVGGVSANSRLRALLTARAGKIDIPLAIPRGVFCTDNAAMIAAAGRQAYLAGERASWELEADPEWSLQTVNPNATSSVSRGRGRTSARVHTAGRS